MGDYVSPSTLATKKSFLDHLADNPSCHARTTFSLQTQLVDATLCC